MNIKSKAGFTLIELMVVAIIVAILAAVAIPLMTGNKRKAMATEAQTGCGTIRTAIRVMQAENPAVFPADWAALKGVSQSDLNGTYFDGTDYSWTGAFSNYVVTAAGTSAKQGLTSADTVVMTVIDNEATWSGTLLQ